MPKQAFPVNQDQLDLSIPKNICIHPDLITTDKLVYAVIHSYGIDTRIKLIDFCREYLGMGREAIIRALKILVKLKLVNSQKDGVTLPTQIWIGDKK